MSSHDIREPLQDAAESKTLSMRGNSLRGNRETLEASSPSVGGERSVKAIGRTTDVHATRESDDSIVPEKRANKAGRTVLRTAPAAAEPVEGRGSTKGNATRDFTARFLVFAASANRLAFSARRCHSHFTTDNPSGESGKEPQLIQQAQSVPPD